ncbi:carboxypeptidase O-like [Spea bombifrons]|uniref:carboxypeptidase O-like n=1 Tax=Spea bombifrons TaxID=233779 RepID=UPI00234B0A80|nr:carboxypeptidase O-like [Spea bombifrons]
MKFWGICLLGILIYDGSCKKVRYDGDQVLKIIPEVTEHVQYLQKITKEWQLDLWKPDLIEEIEAGNEMHVRVPFSYLHQMKENLHQQAMPFTIMITDVQKLIDHNAQTQHKMQRMSMKSYNYTIYHPMEEIYQWMDDIKDKHSDLVTQHYLGHTYENRPIYYLKIGWPSHKKKKIFFMDCGIHAREWISVAYCQWFVQEVLSNHRNDMLLTNVLKQLDFYIVPVFNVDGYVYTWTTERLWRKNRSPHDNGTCYGVDLNRNFNSRWGTVGIASECDSPVFCGPSPASEPETQALVSLIETHKSDILCYINVHSYGQLLLYPYGYSANLSENHNELEKVAKRAVDLIMEKHNIEYTEGRTSYLLYSISGASADWAADLKIKLSYIFELRDDGTYGFELPPDQIEPTCQETMTAVMSIIEYINSTYLENSAVTFTSVRLNVILSCVVCMLYSLIN